MRKINLALVTAVLGLCGCIAQVAELASRGDLSAAVGGVESWMKWLAGQGVVGLLLWHPKC